MIGMSARSGWVIGLSVLAQPGGALAGQRQRVVRAVAGAPAPPAPRPGAGCRCTRGCGPAAWGTSGRTSPRRPAARRRRGPRMCRPPDRWSSVSDAIAHAVGVRADSCTTEVPSRIRRGLAAPPGQRREGVRAPRLGGEHRVEAGLLGRGDQFRVVRRRLRAPISELKTELHSATAFLGPRPGP